MRMTTYTQTSKRRIILKTSMAAGLLALVPSLVCFAQSDSKTDAAVTTSPSERRGWFESTAFADALVAQDFDWLDDSRKRSVPVRLYLPKAIAESEAKPLKPVPLIVFSHGLGGSRNGYQYLGRYWAANGYASLHVQHIGSDRQVWFGNPLTLASRLIAAAQDSEAIDRTKDVSFALSELLKQPQLTGRFDTERLVMAGHSYGASTTMLVIGAKVPKKDINGQEFNLRDPRFKAAMILSAPPFYGYTNTASILGGVSLPTLHVTATADDIMVPSYNSGYEDRVKVFDAIGDPRKTLVVFAGGSHSIFTDRTNTGGAELNPKVKAATQALSLAFLKQTFGSDTTALANWQPQFADLLARYVAPGK